MGATMGTRKTRLPRWLADVPSDKVFYCCSGEVYRNERELEAGLARMTEDYFVYHVNSEKNDFSKWVQDVIDDGYLAGRLAVCQSRTLALQIVSERLAMLDKPQARREASLRAMLPQTQRPASRSEVAPRRAALRRTISAT
ncbi:MAG: hypothetical protein Q7T26_11645 [Dehalococcoidia bacterium]|nr:hypothetical protein [Dehalococcoidia bacterium]